MPPTSTAREAVTRKLVSKRRIFLKKHQKNNKKSHRFFALRYKIYSMRSNTKREASKRLQELTRTK